MKFFQIFRRDDDSHALLRFGNRELRPVQALVFAGHAVEKNFERGREFAYRDRDAAGAKIVASLYHARDFRIAEKPLQFTLRRGVAFLHLGAVFERLLGVLLRRARRTADAVAPRAPAHENDDVARRGDAADDVFALAGCDNGADFEALCDVAWVINFVNHASREPDLVAV